MTPEQQARESIDTLLTAAGWDICDADKANIHAARGVAIREFPLAKGHGFSDYLLYVDGKAAGVIEATKEGITLTGVEPSPANMWMVCLRGFRPGIRRYRLHISPRAWKPDLPMVSTLNPVPGLSFHFNVQSGWPHSLIIFLRKNPMNLPLHIWTEGAHFWLAC